jgi:aryl-alcohol dehydrogenase-like predicted oxidoreductase
MSKIILGTVQMGIPYGINNIKGQISLSDSIQILEVAHNLGVRTLDSAEAYGNAHSVICKYNLLFPEKQFNIITKLPHIIQDDIEVKVNQYLKDLYVNRLDTLLFHSYKTFKENVGNLNQLIKLKQKGLVEKIGVSVYTNQEAEDVMQFDEIDIIQLPFNLFDNKNLRGEILELAKKKSKTIHSRSCYLQGLFFQSIDSDKKIVSALKKELELLHSIAVKYQLNIQQIALNYSLQQPNIDQVLIGVDNLEQLKSNLSDANKTIPSELIEEINTLHISNSDLLNPSLWNNL